RNRCLCGRLGAGFESLAGNDNSETYRVRPQLRFCPLSGLGTREKGRAGLLEASRSRRGWNRLRTVAATSEQSALSFIANRSSFPFGELLLGKVSETVVVQGNAPHNRPGFLVVHLIGNRASFLCTKAPMLRIPETNFLHGIPKTS